MGPTVKVGRPPLSYLVTAVVMAATLLAASGTEVIPGPAASAAPASYVALGDSYTAAPFVLPLAPRAPLDCVRSARNYPHLTAAAKGFTLTDRSCSGATTADMTRAQYPDQPPQFTALRRTTSVVTIGIGGNDNQLFLSAAAMCSLTDALDVLNIGAPCQSIFGDFFVNEANRDGATIGHALDTIHALSPAARVFVVGYPDILPQSGNCYPQLPLTTGDVAYLNRLEMTLNSVLQLEAAAHGATYVDTFGPSVGRDACRPEGIRWLEPVIPGTDAFPIHPNAAGEAADARAVLHAWAAAGL
jgi:hypothetical protein